MTTATAATGTTTYTYNAAGQLVGTATSGGTVTTSTYGGSGLLASVATGGSLTQLTWGTTPGESLPVVLTNGAEDFLYGPGLSPVEEIATGAAATPTFANSTEPDQPSATVLTDPAGGEVAAFAYDVFGNLAEVDTNPTPFGYEGAYEGTGNGLADMRARYYDPATGSFTTIDPNLAITDQPYEYAGGDPVNQTDPSGKFTVGICGGAAAGAAVLLGVGISGEVCLVRTVFDPNGEDDIGITETVGISNVGVGASAGVGLSYQVTNATHLQDLAHWFLSVDVSADVGPGLSGSFFWGKGSHGQSIYGINGGVSLGAGGSAMLFSTYTWVQQAHGGGFLDLGSGLANTLRGIWDGLVPPFLTSSSNLHSLISSAHNGEQQATTTSPLTSGATPKC